MIYTNPSLTFIPTHYPFIVLGGDAELAMLAMILKGRGVARAKILDLGRDGLLGRYNFTKYLLRHGTPG
jgi:hypothetical protein